jgi:hypothetical protein
MNGEHLMYFLSFEITYFREVLPDTFEPHLIRK